MPCAGPFSKPTMTDKRPWWVYVLLCQDGRTYTGIALDVEARFRVHAAGHGSLFTKINRPVCIVAAHQYSRRAEAAAEERALKKAGRYWIKRWCRNHTWPESAPSGAP